MCGSTFILIQFIVSFIVIEIACLYELNCLSLHDKITSHRSESEGQLKRLFARFSNYSHLGFHANIFGIDFASFFQVMQQQDKQEAFLTCGI